MAVKLVCDSSADMTAFCGVPFAAVPLTISTDERHFVDNEKLDTKELLEYLKKYRGRSHSSCPNPDDYLTAFGDSDEVYCVTITSGLSGSYNSALGAKRMFEEEREGRRALIVDSLSAGPEVTLITEKIGEYILAGKSFDEIKAEIYEYMKRTHLAFALQSLNNLARNGRVSPIVAKICGVLGIRVVGKASDVGTLEVQNKARGERGAISAVYSNMKAAGYQGGKVKIHHAENPAAAEALKAKILGEFPSATVEIAATRGLCSFYAELGGFLVGYET